ncbi:hypothetical protein L596_028847 [Steinernema carpocapsae]|uniref:Uncharacterized protein n=1 Tax=Steinernema carpocapsae TaxID=34508 RepID=A0A4U5M0M1_STECR|nr:hypothetical protein L596_028847 [Steinernema carpocapsae]
MQTQIRFHRKRVRLDQDCRVGTAQRLVKFSFLSYPNFAILRSPEAVSRHSDSRIVISAFENPPAPEMSAIRAPKKRRKMRCLCPFKAELQRGGHTERL